jgi:hypothetical protein
MLSVVTSFLRPTAPYFLKDIVLVLPIAQTHVSIIHRGAMILAAYFKVIVGWVWRLLFPQFKQLWFIATLTLKFISQMPFSFRGNYVLRYNSVVKMPLSVISFPCNSCWYYVTSCWFLFLEADDDTLSVCVLADLIGTLRCHWCISLVFKLV